MRCKAHNKKLQRAGEYLICPTCTAVVTLITKFCYVYGSAAAYHAKSAEKTGKSLSEKEKNEVVVAMQCVERLIEDFRNKKQ